MNSFAPMSNSRLQRLHVSVVPMPETMPQAMLAAKLEPMPGHWSVAPGGNLWLALDHPARVLIRTGVVVPGDHCGMPSGSPNAIGPVDRHGGRPSPPPPSGCAGADIGRLVLAAPAGSSPRRCGTLGCARGPRPARRSGKAGPDEDRPHPGNP